VGEGRFEVVVATYQAAHEGWGTWCQIQKLNFRGSVWVNEMQGRLYFDGGDVGEMREGSFEVVVLTDQVAHEGRGGLGQKVKKKKTKIKPYNGLVWAACGLYMASLAPVKSQVIPLQ
jgi:hypothetical protein